MEDAALRTVARLDGTPFPSTARLAGRWLRGRLPGRPWRRRPDPAGGPEAVLETAYCAEVVAVTFAEMGLLPSGQRPHSYDPGRFWSGDDLELAPGFRLGGEIEVALPPAVADRPRPWPSGRLAAATDCPEFDRWVDRTPHIRGSAAAPTRSCDLLPAGRMPMGERNAPEMVNSTSSAGRGGDAGPARPASSRKRRTTFSSAAAVRREHPIHAPARAGRSRPSPRPERPSP